MADKTVERYAAHHHADGSARITLHSGAGGSDSFDDLTPARARLLLTLLRNEKNVRLESRSSTLYTAPDALDSAVRAFNLDAWLAARPTIRAALCWQTASGSLPYDSWSGIDRDQLREALATLIAGFPTGIADPPRLEPIPQPGQDACTRISSTDARRIYFFHAAHSILIDAFRLVPWKLSSLPGDQLWQILDSRSLFERCAGSSHYDVPDVGGWVTPGDPWQTFQFLAGNGFIGATRLETILRLLHWCRVHLLHYGGGKEPGNFFDHWQYCGLPPVSAIISGTPNRTLSGSPVHHSTAGCWGTTGFLRAVLRTVNIPVRLVSRAGHAQPHFMSEGLYLSHGDDPYNAAFRHKPEIPIALLPITQQVWDAWFGPGLSPEQIKSNVGRRADELLAAGFTVLLLRRRCDDIAAGRSHAESEVFKQLKSEWTLRELEELRLWERLDAQIAERGGWGRF